MTLKLKLKKFLNTYTLKDQPLLLGLSGGPDSIALFHLLLELKNEDINKGKVDFGVAHIDHNWRKESQEESLKLRQLAEDASIPFHLHLLSPSLLKGNLESLCRTERLNFFKKISDEFNYQGVILAHHLDDQAETVLKRLFEGAKLTSLHGLQNVTDFKGLKIFRPFLTLEKSEILNWLKKRGIAYFEDCTNQDEKFLRVRFRKKIIPLLKENFGKEIANPLFRLGVESSELQEYLEKKFEPFKQKIVRAEKFVSLDFEGIETLFEIKHLIRLFTATEGFILSYAQVNLAAHFIQKGASFKSFFKGGKKVLIDRKKLFIT